MDQVSTTDTDRSARPATRDWRRPLAIDELQLFAALVEAVTAPDDVDGQAVLRALVSGWARRFAAAGASVASAAAAIEATMLPMLIDVGLDPRATPERVRDVETQVAEWIAAHFPSGDGRSRRLVDQSPPADAHRRGAVA